MAETKSKKVALNTTVNGEEVEALVEPRLNLVDFLRQELGLTGAHVGCEQGVCGACTIVMDGRIMRGCLVFAVQAEGKEIETIEGASESGRIKDLQDEFLKVNALQCGFCTPAMVLTAAALLDEHKKPGREQIREYMSGNFCRCTGYHSIISAIETVGKNRK